MAKNYNIELEVPVSVLKYLQEQNKQLAEIAPVNEKVVTMQFDTKTSFFGGFFDTADPIIDSLILNDYPL